MTTKEININSSEYKSKDGKIYINTVLGKKGNWTNIILGTDIQYFLDLREMQYSNVPLFKEWYKKVIKHFSDIVNLIFDRRNNKIDELAFQNKLKPLTDKLKEPKGQGFGFCQSRSDGYGMGNEDIKTFLSTVESMLDSLSTTDESGTLAELSLWYGDNIGQDKINDFIAGILFEDLQIYTQKIVKETIGYDEIIWTDGGKTTNVLLTPFDIVSPLIGQSRFDGEFYDEFEPIKSSLLTFNISSLANAFGEELTKKLRDKNAKFKKHEILQLIKGLKILNKMSIRESAKFFFNNQERTRQRRVMKDNLIISEYANKLIKIKEFNDKNINFDQIFDYCLNEFSKYPKIAKQMANKIFEKIGLILLDGQYIYDPRNYKEDLPLLKPKKAIIISLGITKEKTINRYITNIKKINEQIEIVILEK